MGALPNTLPSDSPRASRKPPARAKVTTSKCKPRDWAELDRSTRAGTNYADETGWFPVFHAMLADIARLTSGNACTLLVMYVMQDLGRNRKKGSQLPAESSPFLIAELASQIRVDERQINRVLEYLVKRGMGTVARLEAGRVVISLAYAAWHAIEQSYAEWMASQAAGEAEESSEEESIEEAAAKKAETVELTKAPQVVKHGHRSRSIPVTTGVKALRVHWDSKVVDLTFRAIVTSGELVIRGSVPEKQAVESNRNAKQVKSERSGESAGHICPRTPSGLPPLAGIVAGILDPIVWKSCQKTISGDSRTLALCAQTVAPVPGDYLRERLEYRARSPIKNPRHCLMICKEIAINWQKGRDLPATQKLPTPEEIEAMITRERAELKRKREELRRKS